MLRTAYEEIVDVNAIGEKENTRDLNQILMLASKETLQPSTKNPEQVLVIGIDVQNDFMEKGSLAVPNSHGDVERFTRWIYNNLDNISKIAVSIDTHIPHQIFHPCWWIDKNGVNPPPFTPITLDDLDKGNWLAVIDPVRSRRYVEGLKKAGNKDLFIWTYHCIQGTNGCALENQFSNIVYFWEVAKKSIPLRLVKGQDPYSEFYGIIKPEYDERGYINIDFLNAIEKYDKVVIGGEAKDFCVHESIKQILEYYKNRPEITSKIYILEDCMSSVVDTKEESENKYKVFKSKYNINITTSEKLIL
jgi:nicotinamidase-related amidase